MFSITKRQNTLYLFSNIEQIHIFESSNSSY